MSRQAVVGVAVAGVTAALAVGVAVPAGALPARAGSSASSSGSTTVIDSTGSTGSDVVRLTAGLPAAVGPIPKNLNLGILDVEGTSVNKPSSGKQDATAFAGLLAPTGTPIDALDALSAKASLSGQNSASLPGSALPDTHGVLSGSALTGKATVDKNTADSVSNISIADLGALQLGQILGAGAVKQIQTQLNSALSAANNLISALQALPDPTGNIAATITSLQKIVNQLQNTDLSKIALVTVGTLIGKQSITHNAAGAPKATATTELADLNILDGLLHLQAVKTSSSARAGGAPGTGAANGHALVGKVTLGDSGLVATIGQAGKLLGISLPILTDAQQKQLNSALDQLQSSLEKLLSTIGITTKPGDVTKHLAANGQSASATANGLSITVAPGGTKVLTLAIGASAASVQAVRVTTVTPAKPTHVKAKLPATGGSPLPAGIGLGLAGVGIAGLAVRRRRRAG